MKKKIIILITLVLIIITLLVVILFDNSYKNEEIPEPEENVTITLEEYNNVNIGMSYEKVKEIIGGGCNKIEENIYFCSGKRAGTNATLTFKNDILINKSQVGLKKG